MTTTTGTPTTTTSAGEATSDAEKTFNGEQSQEGASQLSSFKGAVKLGYDYPRLMIALIRTTTSHMRERERERPRVRDREYTEER